MTQKVYSRLISYFKRTSEEVNLTYKVQVDDNFMAVSCSERNFPSLLRKFGLVNIGSTCEFITLTYDFLMISIAHRDQRVEFPK
jgi:hypothetical protein